jgi:hypothetical protein
VIALSTIFAGADIGRHFEARTVRTRCVRPHTAITGGGGCRLPVVADHDVAFDHPRSDGKKVSALR